MQRTNFYYDPTRQGYETTTKWKTLTGTPTTGIFIFIDTDPDVDIDVVFDTATITENYTVFIPTLKPAFNEAVTITESITLSIV